MKVLRKNLSLLICLLGAAGLSWNEDTSGRRGGVEGEQRVFALAELWCFEHFVVTL